MPLHDSDWYQNAVIYAVDVEAFQDSTGDGIGDFQGLRARLDYLSSLDVDCLWLLPFYPTPNRDNGYDVTDYYGVDPRHGTLGDFVDFVEAATERDIRVLVDLVVNHTSNEHPWFQQAREGDETYRDYYVWTTDPPEPDPARGSVFPGEVEGNRVWTWDEEAGAYYHHRFYSFQPDLNLANPDVREEIRKIIGFWSRLGVSGFRIDAAGLMVQEKRPGMPESEDPLSIIRDLRSYASSHDTDIVLMAEADVEMDTLPEFAGEDKMNLLLNFVLNARFFHALATRTGDPLESLFADLPDLPPGGQWANFLRNYDELNIGSLSQAAKDDVFEEFAPDEDMRIYGRGIRRRLAPMLDGDQRRLELAYSLLFSMPGSPLVVYGDELGMGEDLTLPGRTPVRTPMQWSSEKNAGFSTAPPDDLVRPVVSHGDFSYEHVNVATQRDSDDSLLSYVDHLIDTRHTTPEIARGTMNVIDTDDPSTFAHRYDTQDSTVAIAHNLGNEPVAATLDIDSGDADGTHTELLGTGAVSEHGDEGYEVTLDEYGYQWVRIEQEEDRSPRV